MIYAKSYIPETELAAYEAVGQAPPANFTGTSASSHISIQILLPSLFANIPLLRWSSPCACRDVFG